MDATGFDQITRRMGAIVPRRAVLGILVGVAGGSLGRSEQSAAKRRKKSCRDRPSAQRTCPAGSNTCAGSGVGACGASDTCRCYQRNLLGNTYESVCGAEFACPPRPCRVDADCGLIGYETCVTGGEECCPGGGNVCINRCPAPRCRGDGRVCKRDTDCCSRQCRGKKGCKRCAPCPESGCAGPCREEGADCERNTDCCSGECGCDFGDCRCRSTTCHEMNDICHGDLECCDGRCVSNGPFIAFCAGDDCRPVGTPCTASGQCCSEHCDADPGAPRQSCCLIDGMTCDVRECCHPSVCEWPGQPPGRCCTPIGRACGEESVCCLSGDCEEGRCCLPFGAACETRGLLDYRSPHCCSGGCDLNCCVPPQGACTSDDECCGSPPAKCVDGTCCMPSFTPCVYLQPGDCCRGNGLCGPEGRGP